MNIAAIEAFLARLHTDADLLERFLAAPRACLAASGLGQEEAAALAGMDLPGLVLAVRSSAARRAAHRPRRGMLAWPWRRHAPDGT